MEIECCADCPFHQRMYEGGPLVCSAQNGWPTVVDMSERLSSCPLPLTLEPAQHKIGVYLTEAEWIKVLHAMRNVVCDPMPLIEKIKSQI
jgi:hypothetical protein